MGLTVDAGNLSYLHYYMTTLDFGILANPGAVPSVNERQVCNILAPLPPSSEQLSITSFLDRETSKIDALIQKKRRLIELLNEKRAALISHAVTKGLDPSVAMRPSGVEWIGEIPADWEAISVRRLLTEIEQGWSPSCESREASEGEWGILKTGCVNGGVLRETEHKALPVDAEPKRQYEVRRNDILMSRASGSPKLVGSVAQVEDVRRGLMISDKIFRLHVISDRILPEFWFGRWVRLLRVRRLRQPLVAQEVSPITSRSPICSR